MSNFLHSSQAAITLLIYSCFKWKCWIKIQNRQTSAETPGLMQGLMGSGCYVVDANNSSQTSGKEQQ